MAIIIGIDPGTNILGFGVIRVEGSKMSVIDVGILHMQKEKDVYMKLRAIQKFMVELLNKYPADEFAIEAPFFGKNVQSMLKLGRAQGVAIACAMMRDIPVSEYAPRKIKQSITGNGSASKEQVSSMIVRILNLKEAPAFFDETDALGVAVCHALQFTKNWKGEIVPVAIKPKIAKKKSAPKNAWSNYLKANPDKIVKK